MRLSWNKEYKDYSDAEHLVPYIHKLEKESGNISLETAKLMDNETLMDTMEQIEELMRYYIVRRDFKSLEFAMRKQNSLLGICRERRLSDIGYVYLEMEFVRFNALLYRNSNKNRQASEYFTRFCHYAKQCFEMLKMQNHLNDEQILYVGWSCIEGYREAASANDAILNTEESVKLLYELVPMLDWLKPYMANIPGICEQTASEFASIGGVLYQNRDISSGEKCFLTSIEMFAELDNRYTSDFYCARSIWVKGLYGVQEFLMAGNPKPMIACEIDIDNFLKDRLPEDRDKAIATGAKGIVLLQKGLAFQQSGKLQEAISLSKKSCENLSSSLKVLEADLEGSVGEYHHAVISSIAAHIHSVYISALDAIGVQYYNNDDNYNAEQSFLEAVSLLTDSKNYRMGESANVVVSAECYQYLALLALEDDDEEQMIFYGTKAVEFSENAAVHTGNTAAWGIMITSCALMADIYLKMRNKAKAGEFADKGLKACDSLAGIEVQSPQLELRASLEKSKKKASRRFF